VFAYAWGVAYTFKGLYKETASNIATRPTHIVHAQPIAPLSPA
jgi:hypothetical protein